MKTILRFFYAAAFVWTFAIGIAAVGGTRFALSVLMPSKTEVADQVVVAPVVVAAPGNDDFPAEPSLVDMQPAIFDAAGSYEIGGNNIPKAFKDVGWLQIDTHEYSQETGFVAKPIVPTGYLFVGKEINLKSISISDREMTFETREVNGESYRFVGHFPKYPEFKSCDDCEYPPKLRGKLTKLKNGKVIAETSAEFNVAGC